MNKSVTITQSELAELTEAAAQCSSKGLFRALTDMLDEITECILVLTVEPDEIEDDEEEEED